MEILNIDGPKQTLRNVRVGEGVKIFDFVNAYGCEIGDGSKIGTFVEIQRGAFIGKNCKISSHTFICEGVHIGDGVFVGHNVSFINDKYPRAANADGSIQTDSDWEMIETKVGNNVSIGTSSTILCGIEIGDFAVIGAGSVVTKNVPSNAVVAGNPAKILKYLE
ncbi:MAG: N-acetyltransferase [Saprospiraceae bacterium]|jgi:acetyltransferase-like isoleucine patch superfamily enzyme|nr:N-acetyltransferase [Saprospiraceae bacterium]